MVSGDGSIISATDDLEAAHARLTQLRSAVAAPKHAWHTIGEHIVANDYYAVVSIIKRFGGNCLYGEADENGRIIQLDVGLSGITGRFNELSLLSELQDLSISGCPVSLLAPILECPKLKFFKIELYESSSVELESFMMQMSGLEAVHIDGADALKLDWVSDYKELRSITLPSLGIVDITPLSHCSRLEALNIAFNPVASLAPLEGLPLLTEIDIRGTGINDLWDVCELKQLKKLTVSRDLTVLPGFKECKEKGLRIEIRELRG